MELTERWYQKEPLSTKKLDEMMEEFSFRKINEISPTNPNQHKFIKKGDKIAVLLSNGMTGYYTITSLMDKDKICIVGRDENGIQNKRMEFCIDSSMFGIYDVGYKLVDKFPWEV